MGKREHDKHSSGPGSLTSSVEELMWLPCRCLFSAGKEHL